MMDMQAWDGKAGIRGKALEMDMRTDEEVREEPFCKAWESNAQAGASNLTAAGGKEGAEGR